MENPGKTETNQDGRDERREEGKDGIRPGVKKERGRRVGKQGR